MQTVSTTQQRHLEAIDGLWAEYGPSIREQRALAGGLQWKTIAGHDYLYRYAPDPITRVKRSTSLGRRSSETEAFYADFLASRDRFNARIEELAPQVEEAARVSKALRLGRVRESIVDMLRTIWVEGQAEHLVLSGMAVLPAYEHRSRAVVGTLPELQPVELFVGVVDVDEVIDQVEATLRRSDKTYRYHGQGLFAATKGPDVRLTAPSTVSSMLDEWEAEQDAIDMVLDAMLDEPVSSLVMARSGNVAPVLAIHPTAWLAMALCRAYYDRSLNQDEYEALVALAIEVSALSARMGFQISHDLSQMEFMAPLFGDDGGRPMRI